MIIVEDTDDGGEGSSSASSAPKIWKLMGGREITNELNMMVKRLNPTRQRAERKKLQKQNLKRRAAAGKAENEERLKKPRMEKGMSYADFGR